MDDFSKVIEKAKTTCEDNENSVSEHFVEVTNTMDMPENIQVLSAKPLDDMMMILTFSTGEQRLFDATVLTGSAFAPLSDKNIFQDCNVVDGVVTWMNEDIDCAPEYMYENSYVYPDIKTAI